MWWQAAAQAGLAWLNAGTQNRITRYNNATEALRARLSNDTRTVSNAATAAQNSLARWVQSVNNQNVLKAGGAAFAANQQTALRGIDARTGQGLSMDLSDAEQMGAQAAAAAFAGQVGESVQMVNISTKLRQDIAREQFTQAGAYAVHDAAVRAGAIMTQAIGGMDGSVILDRFDNNVDVGRMQAEQSPLAAALGAALPTVVGSLSSAGSKGGSGLNWSSLWSSIGGQSATPAPSSAYSLGTRFNFNTEPQGPYDLGARLKI